MLMNQVTYWKFGIGHSEFIWGFGFRALELRQTFLQLHCPPLLTTLPRPMKAQRRHDLKTNALAHVLEDFPGFMREYGSRILLGVILCALVVVLIINWSRGKSERDTRSREAIATARQDLNQINSGMAQVIFSGYPSATIADLRDNAVKRISDSINRALESDDPKVKAEAEVIRGDLNYLLASLPPLPGSETRPSLNGDLSPDELRKNARDAYLKVLGAPLNQEHASVRNARFGLASIAEDMSEWDQAKKYYQQNIDDPAVAAPFKELARDRLDRLPTLQKPILLGRPPVTTMPLIPEGPFGPFLPQTSTSQPANTEPSTMPSTMPSPATQPATTQAQ
jgi:hypothetical protein